MAHSHDSNQPRSAQLPVSIYWSPDRLSAEQRAGFVNLMSRIERAIGALTTSPRSSRLPTIDAEASPEPAGERKEIEAPTVVTPLPSPQNARRSRREVKRKLTQAQREQDELKRCILRFLNTAIQNGRYPGHGVSWDVFIRELGAHLRARGPAWLRAALRAAEQSNQRFKIPGISEPTLRRELKKLLAKR